MVIKFSGRFKKEYHKSPNKIRIAFSKRLEIFKDNPYHPLLNNHSLTGNYKDFRSINVTGDWRALFIQINEDGVVFVMIGKHSRLYE